MRTVKMKTKRSFGNLVVEVFMGTGILELSTRLFFFSCASGLWSIALGNTNFDP